MDLSFDMEDFNFHIDEPSLDISDNDFLADTEITKERAPKTTICPHCGEVIEL